MTVNDTWQFLDKNKMKQGTPITESVCHGAEWKWSEFADFPG